MMDVWRRSYMRCYIACVSLQQSYIKEVLNLDYVATLVRINCPVLLIFWRCINLVKLLTVKALRWPKILDLCTIDISFHTGRAQK